VEPEAKEAAPVKKAAAKPKKTPAATKTKIRLIKSKMDWSTQDEAAFGEVRQGGQNPTSTI
jgi:hypothetical protein